MKTVQITEDTAVVRYVSKPSDGSGYLTPVFANPKTTKTSSSQIDPKPTKATCPASDKSQTSASVSTSTVKSKFIKSSAVPGKKLVNQSPLNTSVSVNKKKGKPASTNIVYFNTAPVCELTEEDEDEDEKEIYEEISDNED